MSHSQTFKESCIMYYAYVLLLLLFGIFDSGDYEIHLPDNSVFHVSFPRFQRRDGDFTICLWLKTKHSGFFIEYEVTASIKQNAALVLGLSFHKGSLEILFGSIRRYQTTSSHCFLSVTMKIHSMVIK